MNQLTVKRRLLDTDIDIIVAGCKNNELISQQKLYKLYYPEMIRICYRYGGDSDAAGLIYNDAMLKVFKNIAAYQDEGKLRSWIKTVVINSSIDFCKKKNILKESIPYSVEQDIELSPDVFDHFSGKEIQKLIAQLPKATSIVFNMFIYEGYTHSQVSGILGISEGTSKWHVSEAKRLLKQIIEKHLEIQPKANAAG